MNRVPHLSAVAFGAICAITFAAPARAQGSTHSAGEMAISANGQYAAFRVLGYPASQFIFFNTVERRAFVVDTPGPNVGDFGWSPDGDELTFVTAEQHTLGGEGRHVWRLQPNSAGPVIDLLALIPFVRSPVLSADGTRLAAFEGVIAGDGPHNALNTAYALFERSLLDGRATRRSDGHASLIGELRYDRHDALFIRLIMPVFPHATRSRGRVYSSWERRDSAGRYDWDWQRDAGNSDCFRLAPGEMLPAWPSPCAQRGGSLVGPLDDGRLVMQVSNAPSSALEYYDERGQARRPTPRAGPAPFDYVAYAEDGATEVLVRTPLPEGAGRTGGADLSSDGIVFAQVINRAAEGREHNTLMVFERGTLVFELPVSELAAHAQHIVVSPSETPLLPEITDPHRIEVAPP
jgi:hypothetical protein